MGRNISIHALLAESDPGKVKVVEPGLAFLSTLSLRRATPKRPKHQQETSNFYPRSPCGERQCLPGFCRITPEISIHALLAESDVGVAQGADTGDISIHALLAESDILGALWVLSTLIFLSTLSLRRATLFLTFETCVLKISIHALLAESDETSSRR